MSALSNKLEFYKESIKSIQDWIKANDETTKEIDSWITKNVAELKTSQIDTIAKYNLEMAKIRYSTIALLDKIMRTQERLEQWEHQKDLKDQKVQT